MTVIIPSECSFVSDYDACSTGRSVEIPLLQNTTHVLYTCETVTLPNRNINRTNEPCSTMPKKKHTQQSDQQSAMDEHEDIDQTETTSPTHIVMKRKVRYERIAWTKEEKHAVNMHFASDIIRKVLPGKERI